MTIKHSLTALLIGIAVLLSVPAFAAEQRCSELGANCVCSEPMNTNVVVNVGAWANPGDSTTKECTIEAFGDPSLVGLAIQSGGTTITGASDPIVLGRLPNRTAALQFYVRSINNYADNFNIGHTQAYATTRAAMDPLIPGTVTTGARTEYVATARVVARAYMYHSDNFTFTGGNNGQCTNFKRLQADTILATHGDQTDPSISAYNFGWEFDDAQCAAFGSGPGCGHFKRNGIGGTNLVEDCCNGGPNLGDSGPHTAAEYQGKWWYFEWAITNRMGPGYRLEVWARNVTDNGPERKVVDTNGNGSGPYGNTFVGPYPQLTPHEINPEGFFGAQMKTEGFRQGDFLPDGNSNPANDPDCLGFVAISHFMIAQWDTNTGQRIGPAYEVEGGVFQPPTETAPEAPTGLRVQ